MRTSIWLEQLPDGTWRCDEDAPRIDVTHDKPLTDDDIEAFRTLGQATLDHAALELDARERTGEEPETA